jgi:O-antigen ligase
MIVSIFIGLIILYICWVKPMVGIAILVQINLIRAVFSLDFNNLNFRSVNEPDAFLGAIIPILGLITIFLKLNSIHKKIKFKLSFIDVFFLLAIFTLIFSTIFSSDVIESIVYTGKFIFLAFSYYFTSKTVLLNTKYPDKQIIIFLKTTLFLGIALGIISLLLLFFQGVAVNRLTIPGVHPIPYSQLMGFSILVIFSSLMIDKKLFFIELGSQFIRGFLLVFLLILLFASNTKGILLSVFLAMLIMLYLKGFRINKKLLLLVGLIIIPLIFYVISVIGYESLFDRLLRSLEDDSVNHRVLSYVESFQIFRDFPLTGSGPGAYGVYGFLDYPHNFFLENMAQYGVLGILMNSYFIFSLFIIFWISNKAKSRNFIYSLLFIFIIYFFVETMVSFTLWMHKGLYVTLGLFSGYYFNKIKTNKKSIIEIIKTAESNVKYE